MNLALLFAQQTDAGAGAAGIFAGSMALIVVLWIIGIIATVFWLWMLIDALVSEPTTNDKILWFLVIFFLSLPGALIYFFVRRTGRPRVPTV